MKNRKIAIQLVKGLVNYQIHKLSTDADYCGSEQECELEYIYMLIMTNDLDYNWELDEQANHWFEKATSEEIWMHIKEITIPKIEKGYTNLKK